MSNKLYDETAISNIADAIRSKNGSSDTYTVAQMASAITSITPSLQNKTVTPTTSQQAVTADANYDGLDTVTVNAMPSGSATTPTTSITANPSISVNASGLITATASASQSITPTVNAGYVSSGTAGTVSVSGSNTSQLTTKGATTYTPTTTAQTIASGTYLTGTQTIAGDANLLAENIVSGVSIFGVNGSASSGGGSAVSVAKKDVNFYDYDGTRLYSYTAAEFANLSTLPANPTHDGLIAQGWNWTLAQINNELSNENGNVNVGQMYITQSGDTEIDIRLNDTARLSPSMMTIAVNGSITVDWGDNTAVNTVTGSSLYSTQQIQHTYASTGNYTIKIHVTNGSFTFYGSANSFLLGKGSSTVLNQSKIYLRCVKAVRIGSGITSIGSSAFYYCESLASITIPSSVTSISSNAFQYCKSLASITIPSSVTSIYSYILASCDNLTSFSVPSSITSFPDCMLYYCVSLASITIPSSVTSIGGGTFQNCYGVAEYHIKPTTPPALGNNAFTNIVSDCIIYVPADSLADYQAASNWSTYASYMQGE